MSKFASLSSNSKFEEIRKQLLLQREAQENKKSNNTTEEESWKFIAQLPKGKASIRFVVRILPNVHNKESNYPWIEAFAHMFKRNDGKFIYTLCPFSVDKKAPCPICQKAKALFDTKDAADEKAAHDHYRKQRYFVNVLVKEDPREGDKNQQGKVLAFEFGKKVYEKIQSAMIDQQLDVTNPLEGHDFLLYIKDQGGQANYDSSVFSTKKTPVATDEETLNKIYDSILDLQEKVYGKGPQSYEKLVELLTGNKVANKDERLQEVVSERVEEPEEIVLPKVEQKVEQKTPEKPKTAPKTTPKVETKAPPKVESADDFDFNFDDDTNK